MGITPQSMPLAANSRYVVELTFAPSVPAGTDVQWSVPLGASVVWQQSARWTLVGVLTTSGTAGTLTPQCSPGATGALALRKIG